MRLATKHRAEIISIDSMQVYRGMDIGTAKPTREERALVPHHLVDVVEPEDAFTVADSQRIGRQIIEQASGPLFLVGGTGLALRAIVDPLDFPARDPDHRRQLEELSLEELRSRLLEADPDAGRHVDLENPRRVLRAVEVFDVTGLTPSMRSATDAAQAVRDYQPLIPFHGIGLDPGDELASRVSARLDAMFENGLLEEVEALASRLGRTASQAVGYKELLPVVDGRITLAEGREAAETATLAVAANQRTFFKRDPRIRWLEWDDDPEVLTERVEQEFMAWIS